MNLNSAMCYALKKCNKRRWLTIESQLLLLAIAGIALLVSSSSCNGTKIAPNHSNEQPVCVRILAVVPTTHSKEYPDLFPKWMKGEEILPAVQVAIKEISEQPNFLRGHQLEVIPVRVPMCDLNEGIVQYVASLENDGDKFLGSVGYFCQNLAQHYSKLIQHKEINAIHNLNRASNVIECKAHSTLFCLHSSLLQEQQYNC